MDEQVFRWRLDELTRAGYSVQQAERLAQDATVDLHEAVRLLERGCDAATAFDICSSEEAA